MRVHRNCCGLDVHKETIAACLISESEDILTRTTSSPYSSYATLCFPL